jgi:hypothetical protein
MCLICGGKIEDGRAALSDGVEFDCAKHGAYVVARSALMRFVQANGAQRERGLASARRNAGERDNEIIITNADF